MRTGGFVQKAQFGLFKRRGEMIIGHRYAYAQYPTAYVPGMRQGYYYSERKLSVGLISAARITRRLMVSMLIPSVMMAANTNTHQETLTR